MTVGAPVLIATLNGAGAPVAVASAPLGETIIAWRDNAVPGAGAPTISYLVLDASGAVVQAATTIAITTGVVPNRISAAATPLGFGIAWEETAGVDPVLRGIQLATFDLLGNPVSPSTVAVNTLIGLDEAEPAIAGSGDGRFIVAWVRLAVQPSGPSGGVWLRRFDALGAPLDSVEVRADNPTASLGVQTSPTVGFSSAGEVVAAWQDGADAGAGGPSRDGDGVAIVGRWFDGTLTPASPVDFVLNAFTLGDQVTPRLDTDSVGQTTVAWRDVQVVGDRIHWRRFDMLGNALMPFESTITPYVATTAYLADLDSGQDGDFVVSWTPTIAGTPIGGGTHSPAGFGRFSPCGTLVESVPVSGPLPAGRIHSVIATGMDAFGNVVATWQGSLSSNDTLIRNRYTRNRILFTPSSPAPGTSVAVTIDAPLCSTNNYQLAVSLSQGTLDLAGRIIPLDPDPLFWLSLGPPTGLMTSLAGPINLFGPTTGPVLNIPNLASLSGVTLWVAGALYQSGPPIDIQSITMAYPLTIL